MPDLLYKEHIRSARAYLCMMQQELADLAGVSVNTIQKIEKGFGELKVHNLTRQSLLKIFKERGIQFLIENDSPFIKYCPSLDTVFYVRDKK